MASSLFTNTLHICFDSVLAMDNPGMVSMFEALMESGLIGFLGFPVVLYEDALTEFFLNGSVRDGKKRTRVGKAAVVATDSALEAVPVQFVAPISTVPPLAPKRKIQKRKRRLALGYDDEIVGEPTTVAVEVAVENIVVEQRVEIHVDPVDQIIEQVIAETAQVETDVGRINDSVPDVEDQGFKTADETELWFNPSYEEFHAQQAESMVESANETEEEFVTKKVTTTDVDLQAYFAQLRASIEQLKFEQMRRKDDNEKLKDILLMHIRDLEKKVNAHFDEHDRAYRALLTNIRKDMNDHKTALSLDIVRSHQKQSTQVDVAALDNVDIRKEVKEQRAMITDLDGQVATVRSELLELRAKAEENHLNLSTQPGFLVDYINRGGDAKKGEGCSISRPQPPPDDQARPSGVSVSREGGNSGGRGSESSSGRKRIRGSGGGSRDRKHSSGGGSGSGRVTYGPYLSPKSSAKYWVYGEKEF
ncbi:hypothetical protein F511_20515 [Dorcoceras hygrometricum]|uniref:Uncharacterized protein n=1 Tax=Dorcoceras hygrometricum TaxID=472368 RepID=A0A2Z7CMI2_9LAMI|nr:hypothetical protein F511_20515 [Dorcoceras hygrometricum]